MSQIEYCETDLPDHEILDCAPVPKGGIQAIGLFKRGEHTLTDFITAQEYIDNIASGAVKIIKKIKGERPDASPVNDDNLVSGGSETVLSNFDRTIVYVDGAVMAENITFYDALNGSTGYGAITYNDYEKTIRVHDVNISWEAFDVEPNSQKKQQMWKVTGKYTSFNAPPLYDASGLTSIFE